MNEVTENTWAGRFRASVLFFFFLQEEGGGRAALTASLCVTALRSLSPLSHIPLCFRRACTLTMHVCSHQLDLLFLFFCGCRIAQLHTHTGDVTGDWDSSGPSRRHRGGVPSHSLSSVPPQQYAFRRHRWHSAHYRLYMSSYVILANECIIFLSAPHTWWSHQCPQSTCDLNEHKYMHCIVSTSSGNYMHAQP